MFCLQPFSVGKLTLNFGVNFPAGSTCRARWGAKGDRDDDNRLEEHRRGL